MRNRSLSLLFWLLAGLYLLATALTESSALVLLKPLPILLLAFAAWRNLAGYWRTGMVLALLFSALGDVLLALRIEGFANFVPGLSAFLLAQLIYATLFWSRRQASPLRLLLAVAYLLTAAALAWLILPSTGGLLLPVSLYLLAISAMALGATFCALPLPGLLLGALVFVSSDSLIAINKFVIPVPAAQLLIMLTYYLAQWLICRSVIQAQPRATGTEPSATGR
ncbi:lysoplasmalogenase [Permianibacter sp. IMCC34836]|uniref:lysoplasmalogenase n=1 Tax=Permianibacter fluminis TaxID=2738515 RepID=UPI0015534B0C|nr:lysoplasmalogenase [Permianibacter fluminis]NQD37169.1 lysoplasmalogenase [Permianibacter fluminis]